MPAHLTWNRYGKARIRLLKVRRPSANRPADGPEPAVPHEISDLTIDVQLEGAFEPVYVGGDNALCVATDTMKNTVYALARQDPIEHVETFAIRLIDHFARKRAVSRVTISAAEHRWRRLWTNGTAHAHAFEQDGAERWTAAIVHDVTGTRVRSGLTDLVLLKTSDSGFSGFPRDEFTTLPDSDDRILATSVTATWEYAAGTTDFGARDRIRTAIVETFAAHDSRSVQHTLYAMAEAALQACEDVGEITLSLPNRHHLLVDLRPFGLDNSNEIFVATDQPFGLIEATVKR